MVDSADITVLPTAKEELHLLLEKSSLVGIPLLVLGNKSDRSGHLSLDELIEALDLRAVTKREISCYGISAKEGINVDAVVNWLMAQSAPTRK